uniref:Chorein N-terminal domain-containing protein n=1 Tax=Ciona savignyi TaxID=51511 RepID=H2YTY3_CIOSA
RLESYLSPFLLSYLSKYVKDIEAKNLQLSLWGGDAVLHNLQFKLDALDNELGEAPFSFVSCQAQEMRLHVPWSKLASEPVVATLNTVECVVKLNCQKIIKKEVSSPNEDKDSPTAVQASYIESLMRKIKNNFSIVINNLILKYIEDDIVLSLNIQTASYNGVNELWNPAFIEMSETSSVLRHVLELKDMTVCLDRKGVSGRVDSFEEPLLFRSNLVIRKHTTYPKYTSRCPSAIKVNLMMDRYELNISEVQLPAVLHLLQLCLHLYYGRIEVSHKIIESLEQKPNDPNDSWASWAWSYVPPILSYEIEKNEVKNPVLAFGIYIKHISIKLKTSRSGGSKQFHRSHSSRSQPLLEMSAQGLSIEIISRGLDFFSCVTSLANGAIKYLGGVPDILNGISITNHSCNDTITIATGGSSLVGFAAGSLFDFRSPENNNAPCNYVLLKQEFDSQQEKFRTTDVFYSEYLYIAEDGRDADSMVEIDFNDFLRSVKLKDVEQWENVQERSWKKIIIGGEKSELIISSYTLLCADLITTWAKSHSHKDYPLLPQEVIHSPMTTRQGNLIFFVPTRMSTFGVRNTAIFLPVVNMDFSNYTDKEFNRVDIFRKGSLTQLHPHSDKQNAKLPCLVTHIPDATFTMNQPMYARHFAAYLSKYRSPPARLMENCNTHYTALVSSINSFVWMVDAKHDKTTPLPSSALPVMQINDVVMESHALQGCEFWENRSTMLCGQTKFTLFSFSILGTPFQLEMFAHTLDSWVQYLKHESVSKNVLDVSFMKHMFEENSAGNLHFVLQNAIAEINCTFSNTSVGGALKSVDLYWNADKKVVPIIQCTHHLNSNYVCTETFSDSTPPQADLHLRHLDKRSLLWNEDSHWLSFYVHSPISSNGSGVVVANMHNTVVNVDPFILDVLANCPGIPPQQLLPVLTIKRKQEKSSSTNSSSDFNYAIQLQNKGVHILFHKTTLPIAPQSYLSLNITDAICLNMMETQQASELLICCLPEITAFTSGHKRVKVTPELLKKGVSVNKYTEFGTLNIGMEKASIYTVINTQNNFDKCVHYIAQPCAAACTVVITKPKSQSVKINAAVHLDVEPIKLKISQPQTELVVGILNHFLSCIDDLKKNCSTLDLDNHTVPFLKIDTMQVPTAVESTQTSNPNVFKEESKSNLSYIESSTVADKLPFTLWLQCTLPRFSATIYHHYNTISKSEFQVEDVSLSLDCQSVYLKLMSSFSTCSIHHSIFLNKNWSHSAWKGITLSEMFSTLPSFLQVCETSKLKLSQSDMAAKPGKFFEITFTQALTSDYHQHVKEEEDCTDTANSSIITSSETPQNIRKCVSEVICSIQPFDIMINPSIVEEVFSTFSPLLNIIPINQNKDPVEKLSSDFNLPSFYFTVGGARLLIPLQSSQNSPAAWDSALLACCSHLQINPRPQNPLTRLVLAPNIYRKANTAGLLQCIGSALEDKQFEITLEDISFGTTKFLDVVTYLNKPTLSDNPALQWNITGKTLIVEEPTFRPIIEQFDLHATVAPAIWHKTTSKETVVCAPSLEANLVTDVIVHLTSMQIGTLLEIGNECINNINKIVDSYHTLTSQAKDELLIQHEDSGFSICESSHASEKPVRSTNVGLMGDALLTSQKVNIMCYQFVEQTSDEKLVKPIFLLEIVQPSIMFQVSKQIQKLEIQFHDANANVSLGNSVLESLIHSEYNYPTCMLKTMSGECDKRTGVPPSLFTATAQHFLSSKAKISVVVGRPIKLSADDDVVNAISLCMNMIKEIASTNESTKQQRNEEAMISLPNIFSSVSFITEQIVLQVHFITTAFRISTSKVCAGLQFRKDGLAYDLVVNNFALRQNIKNTDYIPLLLPVTVRADSTTMFQKKAFSSFSRLNVRLSPVHIMFNTALSGIIQPVQISLQKWQLTLLGNSKDETFLPQFPITYKPQHTTISDDLRTGTYTYITADGQEPLPNQIIFSSKCPPCKMTWCYRQPHAIKRVHITPIPFKIPQNSDHKNFGFGIKCTLESFNTAKSVYEVNKEFVISETEHVDFELFNDNTPFYEINCSTKWRVIVHNEHEFELSPMSLAASMQVETVFNSDFIPSWSVHLDVDQVLFTFIAQEKQNNIECLQVKANNISSNFKHWNHKQPPSLSASCDMEICAQVIDHRNLTWLPVLKSFLMSLSVQHVRALTKAQIESKDIIEIHVSQRVLHSVQYLINICSDISKMHQNLPGVILKNNTEASLMVGQSMTDECIRFSANSKMPYFWRSHKNMPKLHLSVEGLDNLMWSDNFSPYSPKTHSLFNISENEAMVISTEMNDSWQACMEFNGQMRFVNRLSFNIYLFIKVQNKLISSFLPVNGKADYLKSPSRLSSIKLSSTSQMNDTLTEVDLSDVMECKNEPTIIKLIDTLRTARHIQICYCQQNQTHVFLFIPVFMVRSHLPNPVILHVESRSHQKSLTYTVEGCGKEIHLTELPPHLTHHLTIQMNENEPPFDANVPIHCSLRNTMTESGNFHKKRVDFSSAYPNYIKLDEKYSEEKWTHGDGKIQAKLSLHCNSLLVELTPWCLISNQTNMVFCIMSPDGAVTIIQPGKIEIPHYFSTSFQLRTSSSSSSGWLTLKKDEENDHPSRSGKVSSTHVPYNGSMPVLLRKNNTVLDVLVDSRLSHGLRVLTISPRWWFVNASQDLIHLQVLGCTNYHEQQLLRKNKLHPPDATANTVITSSADTTSSFLCVSHDLNDGSLQSCFIDRTICVFSQNLVAAVSVENYFRKRMVNLHKINENVITKQLVLTKYEHNDMVYLILNDVSMEKYVLYNHTNCVLHLREISDLFSQSSFLELKPSEYIRYESFMDAEMFPRCLRNNRSIKMQLSKGGVNKWTEILISRKPVIVEIDIPGLGPLKCTTTTSNGSIQVHLGENPTFAITTDLPTQKYSLLSHVNGLKILFFDDLINHTYCIDMMQANFDDVTVTLCNELETKNWIAKLSLSNIQVDNHAFPETDFPVFISSIPTNQNHLFLLTLTCTERFQILSTDLQLLPLEVKIESSFAQALSNLLQSYMDSVKGDDNKVTNNPLFPLAVKHEQKVVSAPLRFQSITIHETMVILSFRAAVKLYVSIDRGVLSFSKFSCKDVDTTMGELMQELMRHYFADTVYGAGWVIGSLDLLGNPATALRSYAKGMSDFLLMPYEGLMIGPTAFVGGFTRGFSSLLRHLSSGTLRSVTNIASSISRNLSKEQKMQQQYFKLPGETSSIPVLDSADQENNSPNVGLVSGIGKALVGVVTRPLGGAAGVLSRAGETIIEKVGLEDHKTLRDETQSHKISSYPNSASKFSLKVITEDVLVDELLLLECEVISANGAGFKSLLVLSPTNLYIARSEDDEIESVLPNKDIE